MTTIVYRGPLASCNYRCSYCRYSKNRPSFEELRWDRQALERFVGWVKQEGRDLSLFFTPAGEALIHGYYQDAMVELSRVTHKVVIQTNLSGNLDWLAHADRQRLALWCSFHPGQVDSDVFLDQCERLRQLDIRFSVGVVGVKEHLDCIKDLRERLSGCVYLWINAFKQRSDDQAEYQTGYYSSGERASFAAIDPYFPLNIKNYRTLGKQCACGSSVFTVDGMGSVRRCLFTETIIANVYHDGLPPAGKGAPCTSELCWNHIGFVHLKTLGLSKIFGDGILERIPAAWGKDIADCSESDPADSLQRVQLY